MTTKKAISELQKLMPPHTVYSIEATVKQQATIENVYDPLCFIEVWVDSNPMGFRAFQGNCLTPCVHEASLWLIKHYWPANIPISK